MAKKKATRQTKPVKTKAEKLLEAVQGKADPRGKKPTGKPWEPNEVQWSWYILWTTKQHSIHQIARMASRNFETVRQMILKVQAWEWDALTEERVAIAKRQTRALEDKFQEAGDGWGRSKENAVTIKTEEIEIAGFINGAEASVPAIKTTRTEAGQAGDASFLNAGMAALKAIRDIWGVDAPKESKVDMGPAALPTILGRDRDETIRLHLQAELERLNANNGATESA